LSKFQLKLKKSEFIEVYHFFSNSSHLEKSSSIVVSFQILISSAIFHNQALGSKTLSFSLISANSTRYSATSLGVG
jgi:hypothetical protein